MSIIDFDLTRLDVVGTEFVWVPRRHPWAMVDGFSEVVPFPATDRAALAPLSWIAVLDAVRREVTWPSGAIIPATGIGGPTMTGSEPPEAGGTVGCVLRCV